MRLGLVGDGFERATECHVHGLYFVLWAVTVSRGCSGTVLHIWERLKRETSELQFARELMSKARHYCARVQ